MLIFFIIIFALESKRKIPSVAPTDIQRFDSSSGHQLVTVVFVVLICNGTEQLMIIMSNLFLRFVLLEKIFSHWSLGTSSKKMETKPQFSQSSIHGSSIITKTIYF